MTVQYIDYEKCSSCLNCVDVCPMDVIQNIGGVPYISYRKDCMVCFLCEIECKKKAIFVEPSRAWKKVIPY